jgi:hypothetical protein
MICVGFISRVRPETHTHGDDLCPVDGCTKSVLPHQPVEQGVGAKPASPSLFNPQIFVLIRKFSFRAVWGWAAEEDEHAECGGEEGDELGGAQ